MEWKKQLAIGEFLNTMGYDLDLTDKNGFWIEENISNETRIKDIIDLLYTYAESNYIPKEEHEKLKQEYDSYCDSNNENLLKLAGQELEIQKLKEENERLKDSDIFHQEIIKGYREMLNNKAPF